MNWTCEFTIFQILIHNLSWMFLMQVFLWPIGSHVSYIYLHLVDFNGFHVGKIYHSHGCHGWVDIPRESSRQGHVARESALGVCLTCMSLRKWWNGLELMYRYDMLYTYNCIYDRYIYTCIYIHIICLLYSVILYSVSNISYLNGWIYIYGFSGRWYDYEYIYTVHITLSCSMFFPSH